MDGDQVVVMVFGSLQTERERGKGKWMSDSEMRADKMVGEDHQRRLTVALSGAVHAQRKCFRAPYQRAHFHNHHRIRHHHCIINSIGIVMMKNHQDHHGHYRGRAFSRRFCSISSSPTSRRSPTLRILKHERCSDSNTWHLVRFALLTTFQHASKKRFCRDNKYLGLLSLIFK